MSLPDPQSPTTISFSNPQEFRAAANSVIKLGHELLPSIIAVQEELGQRNFYQNLFDTRLINNFRGELGYFVIDLKRLMDSESVSLRDAKLISLRREEFESVLQKSERFFENEPTTIERMRELGLQAKSVFKILEQAIPQPQVVGPHSSAAAARAAETGVMNSP